MARAYRINYSPSGQSSFRGLACWYRTCFALLNSWLESMAWDCWLVGSPLGRPGIIAFRLALLNDKASLNYSIKLREMVTSSGGGEEIESRTADPASWPIYLFISSGEQLTTYISIPGLLGRLLHFADWVSSCLDTSPHPARILLSERFLPTVIIPHTRTWGSSYLSSYRSEVVLVVFNVSSYLCSCSSQSVSSCSLLYVLRCYGNYTSHSYLR